MATSNGCDCAGRPKSTGRPKCVEIKAVQNGIVLGLWKNDAGTINGIPAGTVIDQTYVEAQLNNTDSSERWFMLPRAYRVVNEREDDKTEDVEGVMKRTGEYGSRKMTFEILGSDSSVNMEKALASFQCRQLGFLGLTKKNQITGTNTGDGDLLFTKIEDDTFTFKPVYAQDGTIQKIVVSFIIDETELDSDQDFIPATLIDYLPRYWYSSQPLMGYIEEIASTALNIIVVQLGYMSKKYATELFEGFVSADFKGNAIAGSLYNVTTSSEVVVTAVESGATPGQYTLTLAAPQTDQDVIRVGVTKTGYDFESIEVFIGPTS